MLHQLECPELQTTHLANRVLSTQRLSASLNKKTEVGWLRTSSVARGIQTWLHNLALLLSAQSFCLMVIVSRSQDGCHSSRHHILIQQCPKQEQREGSKGGLLFHQRGETLPCSILLFTTCFRDSSLYYYDSEWHHMTTQDQ